MLLYTKATHYAPLTFLLINISNFIKNLIINYAFGLNIF